MIMKTQNLLLKILFSNQKSSVSGVFGTISFIAKRKKQLRTSVTFCKIPSCKLSSVLKLTLLSNYFLLVHNEIKGFKSQNTSQILRNNLRIVLLYFTLESATSIFVKSTLSSKHK